MSKVDMDFLSLVQSRGWLVKAVDQDKVVGACSRHGCTMLATLTPGRRVPEVCGDRYALAELSLGQYDEARVFLRDRRESLGLTIRDIEECAGMTEGHLAKYEKENPDRIPHIRIFLEWVESLGYEVVLRPSVLPRITARRIEDTRDMTESRLRRREIEQKRRSRGLPETSD